MLVCGTWSWAAPRILRWGIKQDSWAERAKKNNNFVPPLFQIRGGGTSKQISVGAYWIHWNLLSGCRIGRCRLESGSWNSVACTVQYWIKTVCCRSKDHFHWTAPPCTPVSRCSQKWGDIVPHTHRLRRPCTRYNSHTAQNKKNTVKLRNSKVQQWKSTHKAMAGCQKKMSITHDQLTALNKTRGIDDEHHFFFECPHYHEFRQLLEQSVQDTLTGPNSVAVNLSVSLLLAPWTNNNLSRRQCTDILKATLTLISISAHCSFLYFCINKTTK